MGGGGDISARFTKLPVGVWIFCPYIFKLVKFGLLVLFFFSFELIVYIVLVIYCVHLGVC